MFILFSHTGVTQDSEPCILTWSLRHPLVPSLICCPSSDVSHLVFSQPLPSTTPDIPDACQSLECLNNGVCVLDEGKPTCRCVHIIQLCMNINKVHLP